jgi:hypothetical protein
MRAAACLVADRFRDGADFARKAIFENATSIAAHRQLVINCALAGEIEEAKAALATVKRLQPHISLKWIEQWARPEDQQKYIEGFRLAGLD